MQKQMMIIVAQLVDLARRLGLNLYCFGVKCGDSLFTSLVKCYKARPDPRAVSRRGTRVSPFLVGSRYDGNCVGVMI